MTIKEIAIKTIEQLPEDATWEDIQERVNFMAGVRKGLRELDEGKGIAHEKVREEFGERLSTFTATRPESTAPASHCRPSPAGKCALSAEVAGG